ncbi:MAG: type II secretory pathway, ATPase PulE/Tfp pilus assembly pathway, ATPase PilB [Bacteroidetes bacterium]|nr:MAG: type II secretory pathway, ATPase PulE/Tfp pilus assembly pathway, ATPase PilB [Bacteroidota bacterium]
MNHPDHIPLSIDLQQLLTTGQAWHYGIVPKEAANGHVSFYVDETRFSNALEDELEMLLGKIVRLEKQPASVIQKTLSKYYLKNNPGKRETGVQQLAFSVKQGDDFLQTLISEARNLNSSDIHIESYEDKCRVRIRIDGMLVERYAIGKNDYPALINKIKIRANLDISEKRLPQDGRIFFNAEGMRFDIRVSVLPTLHGEKVVLRLLSNDATNIDIRTLGFSENELHDYLEGIKKPHGILLISGPTGSGKTTTLYATLKILNKETTNILTIEDPIEYTLEGINQVQLKESIGLTFASALRTFLRQDPDIIMLGEIRDGETAQMAIRAALTGHLVLSTIHTNSAWGTVSRLADMGVPPFLLASTLNTSVAQRLVRLLCPHCKREEKFDTALLPRSFNPPRKTGTHHTAQGCEHCFYTGYRGRKAVYEVIPIDHELGEHIKTNDHHVGRILRERNIGTLAGNAFRMFEAGETSIEEIYSILFNSYD